MAVMLNQQNIYELVPLNAIQDFISSFIQTDVSVICLKLLTGISWEFVSSGPTHLGRRDGTASCLLRYIYLHICEGGVLMSRLISSHCHSPSRSWGVLLLPFITWWGLEGGGWKRKEHESTQTC